MARGRLAALPPFTLRAEVLPQSLNPEARSVDVVFSTGASVERFDFWSGTRYVESLSMEPDAVRLERLNNGAPFLDAHSAWSVADQIGVVEPGTARIVEGRGVATIRFSKRDAVEPVWQDVRDGIIGHVSVGYKVHKYERTPADDETRSPEKRRAVDWEPYEISAVPMGADDGAKIRAAATRGGVPMTPCLIVTRAAEKESRTMGQNAAAERPEIVEPLADGTAPEGYELRADGRCYRLESAEPTDRERGALEERTRVEGIINGALAVRLRRDDPLVLGLIRNGTPLVEAQRVLLDTLRRDGVDTAGPAPGPGAAARVTRDPLETVWAGITLALLNRINPEAFKLDDNARHFRTHTVLRCAEECLEQRGIRTRNLSKTEIINKALGLDIRVGYHTTSDFAIILGDVANKSLRAIYNEAPQTWLPISSRVTLPDFRPLRRIDLGEAPSLKKVLEHGEYTRGTIGQSKEEMALATYGRIFGITRQALINDDIDAFGRIATLFGRAARTLESDVVWGEILLNRAMADGLALFEAATHKNYTTPGTEISVDALGIARAAIGRQKGPDGIAYLTLRARYLLVPPGLETIADQFTVPVTPALPGSVNPFAGRLTVISEPRLEGGVVLPDGTSVAGDLLAWYVTASPDQIALIEYGYLDGEEGPALDTRVGFDIDGLEVKCRLDFAARAMNYRGFYKNAGAAPGLLAAAAGAPGSGSSGLAVPERKR